MTYKDILITIVSEATETPEKEIRDAMDDFLKLYPKSLKVHKEVSMEEAAQMLASLRKEKLQIKAWFTKGGFEAFFRHTGNA